MKLLKSIFTALLIFTFAYLLGAFAQASFNIINWGEETRALIAFFGGLFAFAVVVRLNLED